MATLEKMWPEIWKMDMSAEIFIMSYEAGLRGPCSFSEARRVDKRATNANWTRVSVNG